MKHNKEEMAAKGSSCNHHKAGSECPSCSSSMKGQGSSMNKGQMGQGNMQKSGQQQGQKSFQQQQGKSGQENRGMGNMGGMNSDKMNKPGKKE